MVSQRGSSTGAGFKASALRASRDTFMSVDHDGTILEASRRLANMDAPELIGVSLWHLVPKSAQSAVRSAVQHAAHPGIVQDIEVDVSHRGSNRRHRLLILPYESALFCQWTDIDDQHQEMHRLRQSERLMQDNEGMTHVGTWYWDITKPHAQWSPELYDIYGLDPATHVPTYEDYLERVHPEDRERVRLATEAVFNDHKPYSHDERIRHADGDWRDLHTWARAILDEDGNLVGLQGVCQDITARKNAERALTASEARFRAIFDSAGVGIALMDDDAKLVAYNQAFTEALEIPETELDRAALDQAIDHDLDQLMQEVRKHGGSRATNFEHHDRDLRLTLTEAADAEDGRWVAVIQDTTAEQRMEAARARVGELEREVDQRTKILGMASHEIKNPLTPLRLNVGMLRRGMKGPLTPEQEEALDVVDSQAARLEVLTRDLLDSTRLAAGSLSLARSPCDLVDVAERVANDYRAVAAERGIDVTVDGKGDPVEADAGRLAQVVSNLVANAIRHATSKVAIHVGARSLTVEDDGRGISPEQMANLFQPFSSTETESGGTGLGLYVCKSIMEAHGGTIAVDSGPSGTRMTVDV